MENDINLSLIDYIESNSTIIYLVISYNDIIIKANKFAEQLTGLSLEGKSIQSVFVCFNDQLTINEYIDNKNQPVLINIVTQSKIPETYYFHFIQLEGCVLAIGEANSNEINQLRANLLDLNRELSNVTRELHKKNAELKNLNELKNNFLGIAAHDLRSPIGIIMGYSDFLLSQLSKSIDDKQLKMLALIKSTSEFLLQLLNELLDISAMESGKLTLSINKVDFVELIKQNIELNSVISNKKNIQIQLEYYELFPLISVDKNKMEQVFNNLISNAIKYSFPETIIKIKLFMSDNYITVEIADQGQGIPESEIDSIFKPFVKTSVQSTANETSTGLGLAIVKNIIIGHKGKIWVKSKVGIGTCFYFSLPIDNE